MNNLRKTVPLAVLFLVIGILGGFLFSNKYSNTPKVFDVSEESKVKQINLESYWKVWDILDKKHVNAASTSDQDKVWGTIQGLARSYDDPYTEFLPPEELKGFEDDIAGSLEGIGIEIGIRNELLTVISPIKNSPAEKAGLMSGDVIVKINDIDSTKMSVDEAVKKIKGPKNTKVKLTIVRSGLLEPIQKEITRDVINIPTVGTELKKGEKPDENVFVIRLYSFNAQSPNSFRMALREFISSKSHRLVLDLRGNPGGYLEAAWDIASFFLPIGKTVVIEDFGGGEEKKFWRSKGYDIFKHDLLKMVVLVNSSSASASEILAGALHDHEVAKIVGTKTFGKGSVQELVKVTSDTSLKVTIAYWLTPKGLNISKEGIAPDIEVKSAEGDTKDGKDTQLEKALEIVRDMK